MNKSLALLEKQCTHDNDKCEEKVAFDQLLAQRKAFADDAENAFVRTHHAAGPEGKKVDRKGLLLQYYQKVLADYGSEASRLARLAKRPQR